MTDEMRTAQYASLDAQLLVDDKVFVSSFAGDGVDVDAIRSAAGVDLFCMLHHDGRLGTFP